MENTPEPFKIAELIYSEMKGELSEADKEILNKWKNADIKNMELYNHVINENIIKQKIVSYQKTDTGNAWDIIDKKIIKNFKTSRLQLFNVIKYVAAASVMLIAVSYFLLKRPAMPDFEKVADKNVIVSGTQKAVLTTSNNEVIELGKPEKKRTFKLNNVSVTDTNNTLTFQETEEIKQPEESVEISYNILEIPPRAARCLPASTAAAARC